MIRQVYLSDETEKRLELIVQDTGKSADDILESCVAEELLNYETKTVGRQSYADHR